MGAFSTRLGRGLAAAAVVAVLAALPGPVARAAERASATADGGLATLLAVPLPGVAAIDGGLLLDGRPHFFTGINAYNATTDWPVNHGCGSMIDNLDTLFGALPKHSLVRTWAFRALGYNTFTHKTDFTAIDRAVDAARAHHDFLILTLSEQAGTCDDEQFHDAAWYAGGYRTGYLHWVKSVVRRYRTSRTVAIYEPVNEPEASNCLPGFSGGHCYGHNTCPARATHVLRGFFDTVGGVIKRLDPRALVSTGTLGGTQCGVAGDGFRRINASPLVDITTLHDYGYPTIAATGGLLERSAQATALDKVFLVEEAGIDASLSGAGCLTLAARADAFAAKERAARRVGADGYLPWMYGIAPSSSCSPGIASGDPLLLSHLARWRAAPS
jgi:mannan endo-1,4-beta-mannosidase